MESYSAFPYGIHCVVGLCAGAQGGTYGVGCVRGASPSVVGMGVALEDVMESL